jgi:hypothetical protein
VATEKYCLKTLDFLGVDFLMYKGSHVLVMADISELLCILVHPIGKLTSYVQNPVGYSFHIKVCNLAIFIINLYKTYIYRAVF